MNSIFKQPKYRGATEVALELSNNYIAIVNFEFEINDIVIGKVVYVDPYGKDVELAHVLPWLRNELSTDCTIQAEKYIATYYIQLMDCLATDEFKLEQDMANESNNAIISRGIVTKADLNG
jgi:hypothetical protein